MENSPAKIVASEIIKITKKKMMMIIILEIHSSFLFFFRSSCDCTVRLKEVWSPTEKKNLSVSLLVSLECFREEIVWAKAWRHESGVSSELQVVWNYQRHELRC